MTTNILSKKSKKKILFTSESVSRGHPDKIADQIADGLLDSMLQLDKYARVALEVLVKTGMILVAGEVTANCFVNVNERVREITSDIGYIDSDPHSGFCCGSCAILSMIDEQSADIAAGINQNKSKKQGAGDQGIMFGYATNETEQYMPAAIFYANKISKKHADLVKNSTISWIKPDGKNQVTVIYEDGIAVGIDTIVVSVQHAEEVKIEEVKATVINKIIMDVFPAELITPETKILVNPSGRFVIGGPKSDTGLTGRKIIVDTYGGAAHHGGGAFSGKDPSKVDRSAAYMMRYLAKNIVAAKIAKKCELQISYAIGIADPISLNVNTFGTGIVDESEIIKFITENFDLTPAGVIEQLDLLRPIYLKTAYFGHFGRDEKDFLWEKLDKVELFKNLL